MAKGRVWKRSALGPIVLIVAATAGCRWVPVRPSDPPAATPPAVAVPFSPVSPVAPEKPAEIAVPDVPPSPVLNPVSDEEALQSNAKTEILDAVAARDDAVKQAIAESNPVLKITPASAETSPDVQKTEENVKPIVDAEKPILRPIEVPVDTASVWKSDVDRLLVVARNQAKKEDGSSDVWACRERVLSCLAEPTESSLWKTVVTALATPPQAVEPGAPPSTPAETPVDLIADMRLCRKVIGFGKTEPLGSQILKPGQDVLLYCEVEGLGFEPVTDGFRAKLVSSIAIVPALGGDPCWSRDFPVEDWCSKRRRDFFVGFNFKIPADLASGEYLVRLIQKDQITNNSATRVLPIVVKSETRSHSSPKP